MGEHRLKVVIELGRPVSLEEGSCSVRSFRSSKVGVEDQLAGTLLVNIDIIGAAVESLL